MICLTFFSNISKACFIFELWEQNTDNFSSKKGTVSFESHFWLHFVSNNLYQPRFIEKMRSDVARGHTLSLKRAARHIGRARVRALLAGHRGRLVANGSRSSSGELHAQQLVACRHISRSCQRVNFLAKGISNRTSNSNNSRGRHLANKSKECRARVRATYVKNYFW